MTEMIDRVSKAIDAAIDRYFAEWKAKVEPDGIPWIGVGDIPREVFARAAIEEYEKAQAERAALIGVKAGQLLALAEVASRCPITDKETLANFVKTAAIEIDRIKGKP